jgi:hypothetical protein
MANDTDGVVAERPFKHGHKNLFNTHFRKSKIRLDVEGLDEHIGGINYIFFVKPDCNIPTYAAQFDTSFLPSAMDPESILTSSKSGSPLLKLFTNLSKSISINDQVAGAKTAYETFAGHSFAYGGSSTVEFWNVNFSVTFTELDYLPICRIHKLWLDYISAAKFGFVSRTSENIANNVLDYAGSVYIVSTLPDGETISFWGKYTGVFPTTIPWSSILHADGEQAANDVSIGYQATYFQCMDTKILDELQSNFGGGAVSSVLFQDNPATNATGFYIQPPTKSSDGSAVPYKIKFAEID